MINKIGIIGDSIAHGFFDEEDLGWAARLGKMMLQKKSGGYVFNNMAQAGDNIADVYHRALAEVGSRKLDLIIVSAGINDLRRRKNSELQLDFSEGARIMYWQKLLDFLQSVGAKTVVTDLLPVVENKYSVEAGLIRRNEDVERYNQLIKEVCEEKQVYYMERYNAWQRRNLDELYHDATHPNSQGHKLIAEEVYEYLKKQKLI